MRFSTLARLARENRLLRGNGNCSYLASEAICEAASSRTSSSIPEQREREPSRQDLELKRKILVNRLLYRSKQRGFLEMDLLLGLWAERNVPKASESLLAAFEGMLDLENPDLFKWLTGQEQPPKELESNLAFQEIQKDVKSQLKGRIQSSAQTQPGREWLRGWDDWKKEFQEQLDSSAIKGS